MKVAGGGGGQQGAAGARRLALATNARVACGGFASWAGVYRHLEPGVWSLECVRHFLTGCPAPGSLACLPCLCMPRHQRPALGCGGAAGGHAGRRMQLQPHHVGIGVNSRRAGARSTSAIRRLGPWGPCGWEVAGCVGPLRQVRTCFKALDLRVIARHRRPCWPQLHGSYGRPGIPVGAQPRAALPSATQLHIQSCPRAKQHAP